MTNDMKLAETLLGCLSKSDFDSNMACLENVNELAAQRADSLQAIADKGVLDSVAAQHAGVSGSAIPDWAMHPWEYGAELAVSIASNGWVLGAAAVAGTYLVVKAAVALNRHAVAKRREREARVLAHIRAKHRSPAHAGLHRDLFPHL
nr:hypothetical protein [uncultured Halomonas sp.]